MTLTILTIFVLCRYLYTSDRISIVRMLPTELL